MMTGNGERNIGTRLVGKRPRHGRPLIVVGGGEGGRQRGRRRQRWEEYGKGSLSLPGYLSHLVISVA